MALTVVTGWFGLAVVILFKSADMCRYLDIYTSLWSPHCCDCLLALDWPLVTHPWPWPHQLGPASVCCHPLISTGSRSWAHVMFSTLCRKSDMQAMFEDFHNGEYNKVLYLLTCLTRLHDMIHVLCQW